MYSAETKANYRFYIQKGKVNIASRKEIKGKGVIGEENLEKRQRGWND